MPSRTKQTASIEDAVDIKNYTSEVSIGNDSTMVSQPLSKLLKLGDGEVLANAVLRGATRMAPFPDLTLRLNDIILLEGPSMAIDRIVSGGNLQLSGKPLHNDGKSRADIISLEAIVGQGSSLSGLSAKELAMSYTRGVNLLAISRRGQRLKERLGSLTLATGDLLVLQGNRDRLTSLIQDFSLLPLAQREVLLGTRRRAFIPLVILALAMASTAVGLATVPVAFFAAALGMVIFRAIPLTDFYKSVDGPILVMLAALIPVSDSLRTTGGS